MKNFILSSHKKIIYLQYLRQFANVTFERPLILGIETSCDDTGVALVDKKGNILGETICSQQSTHLKYGGIIPPIAQELHRKNIEFVTKQTFQQAKLELKDVDGIAVTNRPGLPLSLQVGVRYAKYLARHNFKPIIPIHHMEAHATIARMENKLDYPFLTLLCSGGHCLLALVKNYNDFSLLGETLDDAPGEAFDKISRRLKLRNIPEYKWLSGGEAIEKAALESNDCSRYEFPLPLTRQKNCMFSFAGLKNTAQRLIQKDEFDFQLGPDEVIPHYRDFCLAFLRAITRHISYRTQRAIEYCLAKNVFLIDHSKYLVISGGCASNDFLFSVISEMSKNFGFETIRPKKKLCTDNGVMIAWNGIERFLNNSNVVNVENFNSIDIISRSPFDNSIIKHVEDAGINCKWIKMSNR